MMRGRTGLSSKFLVLLLIPVLSAGAVIGYAAPAQPPKPIVLKFSHQWPATQHTVKLYLNSWVKLVEERSQGRVKIEVYPAGQLAKGGEMVDAIRTRVTDIGVCPTPYFAGIWPLFSAIDMPFAVPDNKSHIAGQWAILDLDEVKAEVRRSNMIPVGLSSSDKAHIFTAAKQVKTMEDLKGLKIRSVGGPVSKALDLMGAISVSFPSPEIYVGIQRKTIDGTIMNFGSFMGYNLFEVVKYGAIGAFQLSGGILGINLDVWNKLPKDIQKIMLDVGHEVTAKGAQTDDDGEAENLKAVEAKGVMTYRLPAAEIARWRQTIQPVYDEYLKKHGEAGRKVMDAIERVKTK